MYQFNKTVGADHFTHRFGGKDYDFLNVLCWGTGKMIVVHTTSKKAVDTRRNFLQTWVKPFGYPELLVVDQGPEFVGEEFSTYLREQGVLVHFTDAQSPWQNGATEKAGGAFKELLDKVILDATITSEEEYLEAVDILVAQRSARADRSDSPQIRDPWDAMCDCPHICCPRTRSIQTC